MAIEHTYKICEDEFTKVLTKAKAIRAHCLDCCSGYQGEVAKCTVPSCPLFPFRFGNEKGLQRMNHLKEGYKDEEDEWADLVDEEEYLEDEGFIDEDEYLED